MKMLTVLVIAVLCMQAAVFAAGRDAEGINRFGFRVLADSDEGKDLMISPVSLEMVLGSLQGAGSAGEKQKISGVLGTGETALSVWNKKLIEDAAAEKEADLEIANSLWLDMGLEPSPLYKKYLARYYHSELENTDFREPGEAARQINAWCSDKTRGMVPSPVSPRQLTGSSLVLVNAVYFKGLWTYPFNPSDTRKAAFHPYDKPAYPVWMMHRTGRCRLYWSREYFAVSLPYGKGGYAMDVLVPSDRENMKKLLSELRESGRSPFFDEEFGTEETVELSLPVFEAEGQVSLTKLLGQYGIALAGYPRLLAGGTPVEISDVLQSVKVKADEKGTEAAAVTTMSMGLIAANIMSLEVDRPFIFTIYDTRKGAVYFTGIVYTPGEAAGRRTAPAEPDGPGEGTEDLVSPPLISAR